LSAAPGIKALPEECEQGSVEFTETMHRLREIPINIVHGGHRASFNRVRMIEIMVITLPGDGVMTVLTSMACLT
jgi:hypothetical protein